MIRVQKTSKRNSEKEEFPVNEFIPAEPTKIQNITIEPRHCYLLDNFGVNVEKLWKFSVEEDDVWIVTYSKCGTTWAQEMCWLIMNNFDFAKARSIDLDKRSPYLEFSLVFPRAKWDSFEVSKNLAKPRLIKSHLPIAALPKELWTKHPKIVYVCRDPRDAAASLYHHRVSWLAMQSDKNHFLKSFMEGRVYYGQYWDHVLEFWQIRHLSNVLFLTYEEMKKDLGGVVIRVCKFLDKPITEKQLQQIVDHLSFESMKKNEACQHNLERKLIQGENVNSNRFTILVHPQMIHYGNFHSRFIRKGEVGGYKEDIPQEFIDDFNKWIENNLKNSDFPYYK